MHCAAIDAGTVKISVMAAVCMDVMLALPGRIVGRHVILTGTDIRITVNSLLIIVLIR